MDRASGSKERGNLSVKSQLEVLYSVQPVDSTVLVF
jgi:hypothetical protein